MENGSVVLEVANRKYLESKGQGSIMAKEIKGATTWSGGGMLTVVGDGGSAKDALQGSSGKSVSRNKES